MNEKIKITHGNQVVTEIPVLSIAGTSNVQKEPDRDSYFFTVLQQGSRGAWKISEFATKEDAQTERDHVDSEFARLLSR